MPATPLAGNDRDGARSARTQPGVPDARSTAEPWMGAARRPVCRAAAAAGRLRSGAQPVRATLPRPGDPGRCGGLRHLPGQRHIAGRERPDRPGAARPDRRHSGQLPRGRSEEPARRHGQCGGRTEPRTGNAGTRGRGAGVRRRDGGRNDPRQAHRPDARRVPVQCRSRHAEPGRGEPSPAGDTDQVGRGLHHPRRLSAHAGPDGADPRAARRDAVPVTPGRDPIAARIATFTSPGCASTARSTDFSRLRSS